MTAAASPCSRPFLAYVLAALMLGVTTPASAATGPPRTILDLSHGWKFFDGDAPDADGVAFDDRAWTAVDLPHTWNAKDGQDGGNNYRRGVGWYRRTVALDATFAGRQLYLQFDGASLRADVYVNGRHLGTHRGGFARFRFDATQALKPGDRNVIAVRVDNGGLGIPPTSADFTFFGGLYRRASLLATDRVHIATMDYASPGVFLVQRRVNAEQADVLCRVQIENQEGTTQAVEMRITLFDSSGLELQSRAMTAPIAAGKTETLAQALMIRRPHLWQGVADPYLYRVRIELHVGGRLRDTVEQPLGLRFFRVDPDSGFFLNGWHVDLHGVNRHQDRLSKGWAISDADEAEDFALIRELGATAIRAAHYQQSNTWYERADLAGLIVWAEIPFVGPALETAEFNENARQQLRELIRQNFNHPAIVFWGVGNETRNDAVADTLIADLAALVRAEDPTRLSTYASDHPADDPRNWHTDVVAWNRYYGWYYGSMADLGPFLDRLHAARPAARIGLSEYGAGASVQRHEENPPVGTGEDGQRTHSEEYQSRFHEQYWAMLQARQFIWAKFVWNMFDFAADDRAEGDTPGRNDKGLVTYDRKTRKDAFYFYKANWSTEPVLHIASRRLTRRTQAAADVTVYSNAAGVELFLNGRSQGVRQAPDRVFRWRGVTLRSGENKVEARASIDGVAATDSCTWVFEASGRSVRGISSPPSVGPK